MCLANIGLGMSDAITQSRIDSLNQSQRTLRENRWKTTIEEHLKKIDNRLDAIVATVDDALSRIGDWESGSAEARGIIDELREDLESIRKQIEGPAKKVRAKGKQ